MKQRHYSVYLCLREDGIYKIGISEYPKSRINQLYQTTRNEFKLISYLEFASCESMQKVKDICLKIETAIINEFANYSVSGREWLKLDSNQVNSIKNTFRLIEKRYERGCKLYNL